MLNQISMSRFRIVWTRRRLRNRCLNSLVGGWLVPLMAIALALPAVAADPRTVYVVEAASYARSGPSVNDYRTDSLSHGQSLTAYGQTKDGWIAVQPPEGSFDWVPADVVEIQPGGQTGKITEDKSRAWIGTHLGRARQYGYQVLLAKDEIVTVLGKAQREGPDGAQTWYKIVPPSGEFRFVHENEVVDSSEELIARVKAIDTLNQARADSLEPTRVQEIAHRAKRQQPTKRGAAALDNADDDNADDDSADANLAERLARKDARPAGDDVDADARNVEARVAEDSGPGGLLSFLGSVRLKKAGQPDQDDKRHVDQSPWRDSSSPKRSLAAGSKVDSPIGSGLGGQTEMLAGVSAMPAQTLTPVTSIVSLSAPRARTQSEPAIAPVGYQVDSRSAMNRSPASTNNDGVFVSQSRLDSLVQRVEQADAVGLQIILSELMTRQSSSIETEILTRRLSLAVAEGIVEPSLLSRGERYLDLARRRESVPPTIVPNPPMVPGPASFGGSDVGNEAVSMSAPVNQGAASQGSRLATASTTGSTIPPATDVVATERYDTGEVTVSGQLLKVYSARPGAPPFSLTDADGRTICYVTPMPGVNVRNYINSQIEVVGVREQLAGLSTANIRVTSVVVR